MEMWAIRMSYRHRQGVCVWVCVCARARGAGGCFKERKLR